jgi:hypothetical protein
MIDLGFTRWDDRHLKAAPDLPGSNNTGDKSGGSDDDAEGIETGERWRRRRR